MDSDDIPTELSHHTAVGYGQ